jgi:hypothetical protein
VQHEPATPARLLRRLDDIGGVLAERGDAIALIGLGSVGVDLDRLDEHSDLDFFVIVDEDAKPGYLASIDWLEDAAPVAYSFENSVDGRKALFADGIFAEYAVFTLAELAGAGFSSGRIVWRRADAPDGLAVPARSPRGSPYLTPHYQANEILTNLFVGLHREARGERLSAARLIQVHAVDRAITLLGLLDEGACGQQDAFAVERGAERRFPAARLPLAELMPGYERNREAALAMLAWLEAHTDVDAVVATAVRELAAGQLGWGTTRM